MASRPDTECLPYGLNFNSICPNSNFRGVEDTVPEGRSLDVLNKRQDTSLTNESINAFSRKRDVTPPSWIVITYGKKI